jgi:hypothetical protein
MSSLSFNIEGINELDSFLKNHSKELDGSVCDSLAKGGRVISKEIASRMPDNLKKFKSILSMKKYPKAINPSVLVGFFGRKLNYVNRRGIKWDAFNLVYWANYGTLSNRDKSHAFSSARKSKSSKWRGGIRPLRFFDDAVNSSMEQGLETAQADLDNIIDKVSDKYGFK